MRKTEYGLLVDIEEVPGSIPGTPTIIFNDLGVPNAPAQAVWVPFRCICQDSSGGAGTAGSVSRCRVALTRRIKVTGVVTVTKTAIRISCRTGRAASAEKKIIEPIRMAPVPRVRSEEHTSELQSLMRSSYAVFSLK